MKFVWNHFETVLHKICFAGLKLINMEITDAQWEDFKKFVKFSFVGVSNFLVNYVIYLLIVALSGNFLLGNTLGFFISVLNAFYWNNKYVFKKKEGETRHWVKALFKTYLAYGFSGLVLTTLLLYIEIIILGVPAWLAPMINLIITTPINFFLNKLWAFRGKKESL